MARFCKPIQVTNKALTKKGRLKGKNKKETKALKNACMHHKITRKGKLKPAYFIQDNDCVCTMCGHRFPASFFSNDEVDSRLDDMIEMNDQLKYLTIAVDGGNEAAEYASSLGVNLGRFKKQYKKARNIAKKQNDVKRKKHKKRYTGSSQYGSWSSR